MRIATTLGVDPLYFVEAVPGDGPLIDGAPARIVMRRVDSECVFVLRLHSGARTCGLGALGPCQRVAVTEDASRWNALAAGRSLSLELYLAHVLSEGA